MGSREGRRQAEAAFGPRTMLRDTDFRSTLPHFQPEAMERTPALVDLLTCIAAAVTLSPADLATIGTALAGIDIVGERDPAPLMVMVGR